MPYIRCLNVTEIIKVRAWALVAQKDRQFVLKGSIKQVLFNVAIWKGDQRGPLTGQVYCQGSDIRSVLKLLLATLPRFRCGLPHHHFSVLLDSFGHAFQGGVVAMAQLVLCLGA